MRFGLFAAALVFLGPLAASCCLASSQVTPASQLQAAQGALAIGIAAERIGDIMSAHQHYQNAADLIDDLALKARMSGLPQYVVPVAVYYGAGVAHLGAALTGLQMPPMFRRQPTEANLVRAQQALTVALEVDAAVARTVGLAHSPEAWSIVYALGYVAFLQQRMDIALQLWSQAYQLNPQSMYAQKAYGAIQFYQGRGQKPPDGRIYDPSPESEELMCGPAGPGLPRACRGVLSFLPPIAGAVDILRGLLGQ